MTPKELASEVRRDVQQLENGYMRHIDVQKYRRYMVKHKPTSYVYWPLQWESPNHNHYTVLLNSPNWQDFNRNGLCYIVYAVFEWKYGKAAAMITNDGKIAIYTPHFFQRYNERILHKQHNDATQTIEHFFKHNASQKSKTEQNGELYAVCVDGYQLGTIEDGVILFKTIVRFDMLYADQEPGKEKLQAMLSKYLKDEYGVEDAALLQ